MGGNIRLTQVCEHPMWIVPSVPYSLYPPLPAYMSYPLSPHYNMQECGVPASPSSGYDVALGAATLLCFLPCVIKTEGVSEADILWQTR